MGRRIKYSLLLSSYTVEDWIQLSKYFTVLNLLNKFWCLLSAICPWVPFFFLLATKVLVKKLQREFSPLFAQYYFFLKKYFLPTFHMFLCCSYCKYWRNFSPIFVPNWTWLISNFEQTSDMSGWADPTSYYCNTSYLVHVSLLQWFSEAECQ